MEPFVAALVCFVSLEVQSYFTMAHVHLTPMLVIGFVLSNGLVIFGTLDCYYFWCDEPI
jgi:hypothetical protein